MYDDIYKLIDNHGDTMDLLDKYINSGKNHYFWLMITNDDEHLNYIPILDIQKRINDSFVFDNTNLIARPERDELKRDIFLFVIEKLKDALLNNYKRSKESGRGSFVRFIQRVVWSKINQYYRNIKNKEKEIGFNECNFISIEEQKYSGTGLHEIISMEKQTDDIGLNKLINELSDAQREAIKFKIDDRTYKEIAEYRAKQGFDVNVSESAIKKNVSRAIKKLRNELQERRIVFFAS